MTRITTLFIICAACFCGCVTDQSKLVILNGSIPAEANNTVYLINSEDHLNFDAYYQALDSVVLDSAGTFSFNWSATNAEFYQLRNGNGFNLLSEMDLYLNPDNIR